MNLPDDLSKLILVSVKIPGLELEPANPARLLDVLAGGVLRELFIVELAAELLLPERPLSGPTSFMGYFMFVVEDVQTAGILIQSVLQRTRLESFATVFQLCPEEQVWKSIYPEGLTMLHDDLAGESVAMQAKAEETFAVWQQALRDSTLPRNDAAGQ